MYSVRFIIVILLCLSLFSCKSSDGSSSGGGGSSSDRDDTIRLELGFEQDEYMAVFGQTFEVTARLGDYSETFQKCEISPQLPEWLRFDEQTCSLQGRPQVLTESERYTVRLYHDEGSESFTVSIGVRSPQASDYSKPERPISLQNFQQLVSLGHKRLVATDQDTLYFMTLENPFLPNLEHYVRLTDYGTGLLRSVLHVGDYILVGSSHGQLHVLQWKHSYQPHYRFTYKLDRGGDIFDMSTDNNGSLFISNLSLEDLVILDISQIDDNKIDEVHRYSLDSFASGVTSCNGFAYAVSYSGVIYSFVKDSNTNNWVAYHKTAASPLVARITCYDKHLAVVQHGRDLVDIFASADTGELEHLQTYQMPGQHATLAKPIVYNELLFTAQWDMNSSVIYNLGVDYISEKTSMSFDSDGDLLWNHTIDNDGDYLYGITSSQNSRNDRSIVGRFLEFKYQSGD